MRNNFFTVGDSWPSGDSKHIAMKLQELDSQKYDYGKSYELIKKFREWSFPKYLSQHFNMNNINLGFGGASNDDILFDVGKVINSITDDDFILVSFTTPFRTTRGVTQRETKIKNIIDNYYYNYILKAVRLLEGKKYLLTHAFTPIFGYFDTESFDYIEHFIEWDKKNNSLVDIITNTWLDESKTSWGSNWESRQFKVGGKMEVLNQSIYKKEPWEVCIRGNFEFSIEEKVWVKYPNIASCFHPSISGHKVIAKTLLPYIEERM